MKNQQDSTQDRKAKNEQNDAEPLSEAAGQPVKSGVDHAKENQEKKAKLTDQSVKGEGHEKDRNGQAVDPNTGYLKSGSVQNDGSFIADRPAPPDPVEQEAKRRETERRQQEEIRNSQRNPQAYEAAKPKFQALFRGMDPISKKPLYAYEGKTYKAEDLPANLEVEPVPASAKDTLKN